MGYLAEKENRIALCDGYTQKPVVVAVRKNKRCLWRIYSVAGGTINKEVAQVKGNQPEADQRRLVRAIVQAY